jgi:hypothetical protein
MITTIRRVRAIEKQNRQSRRFVLERALNTTNVVSSQRLVRLEVMAAYRRSSEKCRQLYKRLADAK